MTIKVAYLSSSDQICALQISAGDSGGLSKKKCRNTIKHSGGRGGWVYCTFYRVTLRSLGNIHIGLGDAEGGFAKSLLYLLGRGWDGKDTGYDLVRFLQVLSGPHWTRLGWKGLRR